MRIASVPGVCRNLKSMTNYQRQILITNGVPLKYVKETFIYLAGKVNDRTFAAHIAK